MTATQGIVVLLGRVLFAVFFIRSGIAHLRKHEGMTGYARSAGFPFPGIGGWPAGVWLLAGAASIALGIWADVGSLMIALFLVLAALHFHPFWTIQDEGQRQTQASNFYRNIALLGASLALWGSSSRRVRPVGSRSPARCSEPRPPTSAGYPVRLRPLPCRRPSRRTRAGSNPSARRAAPASRPRDSCGCSTEGARPRTTGGRPPA
jgi:putative oxidoreductase